MCVINHLRAVFHMSCKGIFMAYVHTKFHIPTSNDALVIFINPKAKETLRMTAMLFRGVQKHTGTKVAYLCNFQYDTLFQDPKLSIASVALR